MESQLTCPLCNKQYKDQNIPRLLTMCGHTYCQKCIQSLIKPIYLNKINLIDLEEDNQQQKKGQQSLKTQQNKEDKLIKIQENETQQSKQIIKSKQGQQSINEKQKQQNNLKQQQQNIMQEKEQQKNKQINEEEIVKSINQVDQPNNAKKEQQVEQKNISQNQKQKEQTEKPQKLSSQNKKQQQKIPDKYKIQCPEDKNTMQIFTFDINAFPKNIALMKLIQSKKQNLSFKDDDSSFNVSKIAKQEQIQEDDQANDLITAIKQGQQAQSKSITPDEQQVEKEKQLEMCLLHQKPLQIVCMIDLMRICANCAIFGQHKGHDFKSLEEIQKQSGLYIQDLLKIMDQKQTVSKRISNQQSRTQLMGILDKRKQNVKREINERYKHLREQIDKFQKEDLQNLDGLISKTSDKIKHIFKLDKKVVQKYSNWENQSFSYIYIIQGNNFQEKLQLLFPQSKQSNTIFERGIQIIKQMQNQQKTLSIQVQQMLDGIKLVNSDNIYKTLSSFVVVTQQVKNQGKNSFGGSTQINQDSHNKPKKEENSDNSQNIIGSPQMEQSLLQTEQLDQIHIKKPQFQQPQIPIQEQQIKIQKIENQSPIQKLNLDSVKKQTPKQIIAKKIQQKKQNHPTTLRSNFQVHERPNKKKLTKLKIPQKFQKTVDGIANDSLENVDLSFAQLGDSNLSVICEFLRGSKAKNVKLIRNKLTDDGVKKIIPYFGNVIVLNLSQNMLTQNVIDLFIDHYQMIPNLKNLILSQNKIVERKSKTKLQKLRGLGLTVSV